MDDEQETTVEPLAKRKRFTLLQKDDAFILPTSYDSMSDNMTSEDFSTIEEYQNEQTPISYDNSAQETRRSRGRPRKRQEALEWSDDATEALINLWSTKGELYSKAHPHFSDKEMKDRAVEDIQKSLRNAGFDFTVSQIWGKFQSLRTYFCSQRTKLNHSKRSGAVHEDAECRWRFFKSLHFLDDNMKIRETYVTRRLQEEENAESSSRYLRSMAMHESRPNHFSDEANFNGDTLPMTQIPQASKTDDQIFGEMIGNMMGQLPSGQNKDLLKLEIQQIIIKAKYETPACDR